MQKLICIFEPKNTLTEAGEVERPETRLGSLISDKMIKTGCD